MKSTEKGGVMPMFAVAIAALVGVASLMVDLSTARALRLRLQHAADSGVLAGARRIHDGGEIVNYAALIFSQNAPISGLLSVETGQWTWNQQLATGTFTPGGTPRAVRIVAQRPSPVFLGRLWNVQQLFPKVEAIARVAVPGTADCLIPYGVVQSALIGKRYGDVIPVGVNNSGNWGKLDIGINASSQPEFVEAVINSPCTHPVTVGDTFTPGTGFAGVSNAFEQRLELNPIIVIPVVQGFPVGNSDRVTVVGFIVAELLRQEGRGHRWNGQIRILNSVAGWNPVEGTGAEPYAETLALVR